MSQKLLFVINEHSGNKDVDWHKEIHNFFNDKDYELDLYNLQSPPQCDELKKYIASANPEKVIAVGGDGTVTMVAGLLAGKNIPLGIVPGGSANGMAKELNISNNPKVAFEIIDSGIIKQIDTILINNEHLCLHLSDIGINAQLIKNFEDGNERGQMGYAKVAFKTLINKQKLKLKISNKTGIVYKEAIMVVIANAAKYGTGAVINPDGEINDNLFEVLVIKKLPFLTVCKMMFRSRFDPQNIETYHCKSIDIESKHHVHFQVDGEYLGKIKKVTAQIQPHNLLMILPEQKNKDDEKVNG